MKLQNISLVLSRRPFTNQNPTMLQCELTTQHFLSLHSSQANYLSAFPFPSPTSATPPSPSPPKNRSPTLDPSFFASPSCTSSKSPRSAERRSRCAFDTTGEQAIEAHGSSLHQGYPVWGGWRGGPSDTGGMTMIRCHV